MTWTIASGPEPLPRNGDHERFRYVLRRGEDERDVVVEIAGTTWATDPDTLPSPLDAAIRSGGRTVVERCAGRVEPPSRVLVNSAGVLVEPREGVYAPGDRVYVLVDEAWIEGRFVRAGDRRGGRVENPAVTGGTNKSDVAWVQCVDDHGIAAYKYSDIRARPPRSG